MRGLKGFLIVAVIVAGPWAGTVARAQSCRVQTIGGAGSTVSMVSGLPVAGTLLSSTGALDGSYFQVGVAGGASAAAGPAVLTMFSTDDETGLATNGPVYYGAVFVNPTDAAVSVTRFDFVATVAVFSTGPTGVQPTTGWTRQSTTDLRWTGTINVAAHSAQQFIVSDVPPTATSLTTTVTAQATTGSGTFSAPGFTITMEGSEDTAPYSSNAVVGFDTAGGGTYATQTVGPTVAAPGTATTFSIRVRETSGQRAQSSIDQPLTLTMTIPAGWTNVALVTATSPWSSATAAIVQPTAVAPGSFSIQTNATITDGTSTAANSLRVSATSPAGTYGTTLFPFTFTLAGQSVGQTTGNWTGHAPIASQNQSIVPVTGNSANHVIDARLTSVALPGPVRQIDFRTDFNVTYGASGDQVKVNLWNVGTSAWDTIATVTPSTLNSTVTRSFTTDFEPYVDATGHMIVQFYSTGSGSRVLGIDLLQWTVTLGYSVNNATGNDNWGAGVTSHPGERGHPYASIVKAASMMGSSGAAYVDVGNSQTIPYAANITLAGAAKAGTAGCPSLFQGLANGTTLPLVQGTNPASDVGFEIGGSGSGAGANYVTVDSFQIANAQVGLYSDPGATGIVFSNNVIGVPSGGYGIVLDTSVNASVLNNRSDGANNSTFYGIYDYSGTNALLDGNRIRRHKGSPGIFSYASTSLVIQRNVVQGSYIGIHLSHPTNAARVYNNTVDTNDYLGLFAESPAAAITSRNNILTNNGVGWGADSQASANLVGSDYEDVWNNKANYAFHGTVASGAHSISAAPNFVQTSDPTLSTYFKLNAGSAAICTGTNLGLSGYPACTNSNYDIGAVVSH